ncbi:MAG: DUF3750 domain-containing protein [Alphaproteobacteria bacterium]|nr:DUF3750 domain-containing protein [Alphaproteobacteria bacterium]
MKWCAKTWVGRTAAILVVLLVGPTLVLMGGSVLGSDWHTASREAARIAPDPMQVREAVVHVYGARAFSWRGAFGVHTWIAAKPSNATAYTVYQVIGWRLRSGLDVLSIKQDVPDRYWFGSKPELLAEQRGDGVDALIEKIDRAARAYPYKDEYTVWPGPNSNTFTAWVARHAPELKLDLPPTAIGKDFLGSDLLAAAPSGTGYQVSLGGMLGVLVGVEEGLEINVAGLTFGVDPLGLAFKFPGIGRIGLIPKVTPNPAVQ